MSDPNEEDLDFGATKVTRYRITVRGHAGNPIELRGFCNDPALIRKTERKPIRVFLQDGSNDQNQEYDGDAIVVRPNRVKEVEQPHHDGDESGRGAHVEALANDGVVILLGVLRN